MDYTFLRNILFFSLLPVSAMANDFNCVDQKTYYLCNLSNINSSIPNQPVGQIPNVVSTQNKTNDNTSVLINKVKSAPIPIPTATSTISKLNYFTEEKVIDCLTMYQESITNPRSMWWKTPPSSILQSKEGYVKTSFGVVTERVQNGYIQLLLTYTPLKSSNDYSYTTGSKTAFGGAVLSREIAKDSQGIIQRTGEWIWARVGSCRTDDIGSEFQPN